MEFWLARELQRVLGYDRWENFLKVIVPEQLPPAKDAKRVERRLASEEKKLPKPK